MDWQDLEADRLAYTVYYGVTEAERKNSLETLVNRYILPVVDAEARKPVNRVLGVSRDAVTHVFEQLARGGYNHLKGHFKPWCRRVVQNYHVDVFRRTNKHKPLQENMIDERIANPLDLQADFKLLANEPSDRLRDSVKQIASAAGWKRHGKTNYLPVFLLELRRVLAMKLLQTCKDDPRLSLSIDITPEFIIDVVRCMVIWTPAQDRMKVREGYPTLGDIWSGIEAELAAGNMPTVDLVIKNIVAAGGTKISRDTWYQRSHRAVELAQQLVPDEIGGCSAAGLAPAATNGRPVGLLLLPHECSLAACRKSGGASVYIKSRRRFTAKPWSFWASQVVRVIGKNAPLF